MKLNAEEAHGNIPGNGCLVACMYLTCKSGSIPVSHKHVLSIQQDSHDTVLSIQKEILSALYMLVSCKSYYKHALYPI